MTLPPLNALRAFEAAGRNNSFAKAGVELRVSANAVSRHVKLLEEHLSLTLFDRKAQGLGLTEVGKHLLPEITEAFHRIDSAAMRARITSSEIRVTRRRRLLRLADYHELHPSDCEQFSEMRGTYDVGIVQAWWLDEIATDVETHHLRYERLAPACSSAFARQPPKLRKPTDLRDKPLLHALDTKTGRRGLTRSAKRCAYPARTCLPLGRRRGAGRDVGQGNRNNRHRPLQV
jgi:LysR family glycine cleavage system transcriptional activator